MTKLQATLTELYDYFQILLAKFIAQDMDQDLVSQVSGFNMVKRM